MLNTHILNIRYQQSFSPEILNKIFYNLFSAGVIEAAFEFTSNSITILPTSFLIHPENKTDIIVRIDTTVPVTIINKSRTNTYLVARYRWENANKGAEFLFVDDSTIVGTDVILAGLILDGNGGITGLNYDEQEKAKLKIIQKDTNFPLVAKLDGYKIGHNSGEIPISDTELNTDLNTHYLNGKDIRELAVTKQSPIITTDEAEVETITYPEYPEWMDVEGVDKGEGVTTEYLMGQKIQPQDGATIPGDYNQIPVANRVLQRHLNAQYLSGNEQSDFSKVGHTHNMDDVLDGGSPSTPDYYRVIGADANLASANSIAEDDIGFMQVDRIAYDTAIGNWYQPIYETGILALTAVTEGTITFKRIMKNARVFLQRAPKAMETLVAGAEKRTARVTSVTSTNFKAKQLGSIKLNTGEYIRSDADDAAAAQYFYFVIGEKA